MSDHPWDDWIPGVLSESQLKTLCTKGYIKNAGQNVEPDRSSLDLHLTDEGYRMVRGSVKPFGSRYLSTIENMKLVKQLKAEGDGTYVLQPKQTYLFRIAEQFGSFDRANFHGQATAKSSVGRVDVLARLIVDGMSRYEAFDQEALEKGDRDMYLEITPFSFPVRVKGGISLTQLRIFYCEPQAAEISSKELYRTLLKRKDGNEIREGYISVDVTETELWDGSYAAFSAKTDKKSEKFEPISLWKEGETEEEQEKAKPDPREYWEAKKGVRYGGMDRFEIESGRFYILRSKETISLPPGVAVYCRANDETIGEMRIHYAGFVHPWFGYKREDGEKGTPLIFEVRGHDVRVSLGDDEKMCRLIFYRMSKDSRKPKKPPSYGTQTLNLSQFFKKVY